MAERRRLLTTMLDVLVYVDAKGEKRIVAIKPKAPFKLVLQVATMKEGSGIALSSTRGIRGRRSTAHTLSRLHPKPCSPFVGLT